MSFHWFLMLSLRIDSRKAPFNGALLFEQKAISRLDYITRTLDKQMRKLFTYILLLSALALGACATPVLNHASQKTERELLLRKQTAANQHRLLGTWLAIDKRGDLRAGTIAFESSGFVIIAPNGSQPLIGRWRASLHRIHVSLPHNGTSVITYTFSSTKPVFLTLFFKNGTHKNFARLPVKRTFK